MFMNVLEIRDDVRMYIYACLQMDTCIQYAVNYNNQTKHFSITIQTLCRPVLSFG